MMPDRKRETTRKKAEDSPTFEALNAEIQEIITRLDGDDYPLEALIRDYEKGTELIKKAQELLNHAEQRVRILQADSDLAAPDDE